MLEEAAVFNAEHRIHHVFGKVFVADKPALRPLLALEQGGNKLGLKLIRSQLMAIAQRIDTRNLAALFGDHGALGAVVRVGAGLDLKPVSHGAVGADFGFVFVVLRVASAAQCGNNLVRTHCLARMKFVGMAVNLRGIAENLAAHPPVNDDLVLVVVKGKDGKTSRQRNQSRRHPDLDPALRPNAAWAGPRTPRPRRTEFTCLGGHRRQLKSAPSRFDAVFMASAFLASTFPANLLI